MNKVLKLSAKRDKLTFKLFFPETGEEKELPVSWLRYTLERFTKGVRLAYLETLREIELKFDGKGKLKATTLNSNAMTKNFPEEYAKFTLNNTVLEVGKDNIGSSIRYTIEKDIKRNLREEYKTITIKRVPLIARVHTVENSKPYEEAFKEVFRIFEVSDPDEKRRVSVRIGAKFFKRVEIDGRKCTPIIIAELTMRLRGRDFRTSNSYYQILKRIAERAYKVAYAGLSFKEDSGVSLLIAYEVPGTEDVEVRTNILGIDLGQACPVYWCVIDRNLEEMKLSDGSIPRGKIEYPINLEKRVRSIWRVRKTLLSSLRRLEEQVKLVSDGREDLKKRLLKQKEEVERNLDGIRRKERNLMKKINEYLANEVIRIALREGCGKIRVEKLENINKNELYFPKWNYGQLQSFIEQRAKLHGIEVEKVNPRKTSQRCPSCGYVGKNSEEVRPNRDTFKCPNCGKEFFADFVGAFNIAVGGIDTSTYS